MSSAAAPEGAPASRTEAALRALRGAVESPPGEGVAIGNWRWTVRQRVQHLRDALTVDSTLTADPWAAAVGGALIRERNALLVRLAEAGPAVLTEQDLEALRRELGQLVTEVAKHLRSTLSWRQSQSVPD